MITNSIFILGAGSSAEYGMPLWKDLAPEMRKKFDQLTYDDWDHAVHQLVVGHAISYDEKAQAISFCQKVLNAVGKDRQFSTIDEAISRMLEETANAEHNFFFAMNMLQTPSEVLFWYIMFLIFRERMLAEQGAGSDYSPIDTKLWLGHHKTMGWLRYLMNEDTTLLANAYNIFIDFNYDNLFYAYYCYLLQYPDYFSKETQQRLNGMGLTLQSREGRLKKLSQLEQKKQKRLSALPDRGKICRGATVEREFSDLELQQIEQALEQYRNYDSEINNLNLDYSSDWRNYSLPKEEICVFQPHGFFQALNKHASSHHIAEHGIFQNIDRSKSYRGTEPISCHDTRDKNFEDVNQALKARPYERLIIMGVGPTSLRQNLDKIAFDNVNPKINEIWFTCFEHKDIDDYEDYFAERFGEKIDMKIFDNCTDLAKALAQEFGEA